MISLLKAFEEEKENREKNRSFDMNKVEFVYTTESI